MEQAFKSFLPVRMPNRILEMIHLGEMKNRIFKLKTNTNFTTFFPFFLLLFFSIFPYFIFSLSCTKIYLSTNLNVILFYLFQSLFFYKIILYLNIFASLSLFLIHLCDSRYALNLISKWPFLLPLLGLISAIFKKFTLLHMKSFKM